MQKSLFKNIKPWMGKYNIVQNEFFDEIDADVEMISETINLTSIIPRVRDIFARTLYAISSALSFEYPSKPAIKWKNRKEYKFLELFLY